MASQLRDEEADVFVNSNFDQHAHKLSLLSLAKRPISFLRISPRKLINESELPTHIMQVPNVQGQLQQFWKIEECAEMVQEYEKEEGLTYGWVLWTRLDSFWVASPPPLHQLDRQAYNIPPGTDWGGVNDRLGVGQRDVALRAMKRLSSLFLLAEHRLSNLNGERCLQQQLKLQKIDISRVDFPFCILSFKRKRYAKYPFKLMGAPTAINGCSCRPCTPIMGTNDTCRATVGYERNWSPKFDMLMGEPMASLRKKIRKRQREECLSDWQSMQKRVRKWDAPSVDTLCIV